MAELVATGGQVLVMVPEIALTPQTLKRFEQRFSRVGMLHSNLTDHERLQTWLKCKWGQLDVLIGTRSAVFAPFKNLRLIIVDEEHDSSYKQQDGLRYSARDVAIKRAHSLALPIVLGSATPSLESIYNVRLGRFEHTVLSQRAGGASMPSFKLIDMRGTDQTDGISVPLEHVIRRHLNLNGQVLVFLNRRGFAPTLLCTACGWQALCPDCDARLTLHRDPLMLACHHCGLRLEVSRECPECGHASMLPVGAGTQRTEARLERLFPTTPIYRIDRDTTRSTRSLEATLAKVAGGDPCIMVGTQMLAKGHHFPAVTLVAVINADAGFLSPDFRAPERTAQIILQVAGRAGRASRPGEVFIQSHQPDNPTLTSLIEEGYRGFADKELLNRQQAGMPPIKPLAMLRADAANEADASNFLGHARSLLASFAELEVYGPVAAPLARVANRHRAQVMIIADQRTVLHRALDYLRPALDEAAGKMGNRLRWSIDVDPYDSL